jgi:hypothetical protein
MPTTTPNFGWSVPVSTDLVKDGATAIELLGDSIDTSLVDLKGGTTGQVLAKASGTDMDFSWVAVDPLTILDAKGDLISATAADTPARLAVGTNGQVLTADSTEATGIKWATASAGVTPTYTLINAGGTTLSGSSVTISFSGYYNIWIHQAAATKSGGGTMYTLLRFNGDGGATTNYTITGGWGTTITGDNNLGGTEFAMAGGATTTGSMYIQNAQSTDRKPIIYTGYGSARSYIAGGFYNGAAAMTSVTFTPDSGTFGGGTVFVYGY